jgi:hypothetical protein
MSSVFTLKALGLNTSPNQLSIPDGSLTGAKNITISREDVAQSRRGFQVYGNSMGTTSDRAKQLADYKSKILRHFANTLQYDDGSGNFSSFSGNITETQDGLRIKSIESNGNFYLTTSDGVKKISARTSSDFTTASNFVVNAGAVKAVDIAGFVNYSYGDQTSFLTQDSAVAYRVVWGYRDLNNNLVLGTPSQRIEVYNPLLNLLLQDFGQLLQAIDNIGEFGSLIDDKNYVNTLKLGIESSSAELRTNLIALTSKLDNDLLLADNDGAPTGAPLEVDTVVISSGVATITFASGNPSLYLSPGSSIMLNGFTPVTGVIDGAITVASVNSTTLTFNTAATGVVTVSGSATIYSNDFRAIAQPVIQDTPATDAELVQLQDYITFIIEQLIQEPNSIIPDAVSSTYINLLDVTKASDVTLTVTIPEDITSEYFYQIYRSSIFTATDTQVLSTDVFPNDELQLVYEAFPSSAQILANEISIIDIVPDSFRGANLYTNASTGEGILQANDVPPFAKDINVFKNSVFYANTHTRHRRDISLIGVQNMIVDANNGIIPTLTIASATAFNTYKFVIGVNEQFTITTTNGASLASSGTASYIDIYSGLNTRSYRLWYKIGTAVAPASGGHQLVQVIADSSDSSTKIAERTRDSISIINKDFTASSLVNVISVEVLQSGETTDASSGTSGFTINIITSGVGEDAVAKEVLLSNNVSPAIAVQETSQSLTRVINKNASEQIYVYYTSGAQEVPGKMVFEARSLNNGQFFLVSNNSNTGESFTPAVSPTASITSITVGSPSVNLVTTAFSHGLTNLDYVFISGSNCTPSIDGYRQITYVSPTSFRVDLTVTVAGTSGGMVSFNNAESSSNEDSPNRVYYSKYQQPESVPILNYFDVGAKDRAILRIFPLRDSLFVFKEDGLYRISGESTPFNLALFDGSIRLKAPDSLDSVDNVIYGWTDQGISSITESGTRNISRPIDTIFLPVGSKRYPNFPTATWGIGYDSDNSYTVYTVSNITDTTATIGFKYNTQTNTWTSVDRAFNCGVLSFDDDKLYMGAGDINSIEKERKLFDRTDYADREYVLDVLNQSSGLTLMVNDVDNIQPNDVFVQEQTVSIYAFNSLLRKLDADGGVTSSNYLSTLEAIAGSNIRDRLVELSVKLDSDSLQLTDYESAINDITGSITSIGTGSVPVINSVAHGLVSGRIILLSGTNTVPSLNGEYTVTVVDANNFTVTPGFTITTAGTAGNFITDVNNFEDLKVCYNTIINKLNLDTVVSSSNYQVITENTIQEVIIESINRITNKITIAQQVPYIQGEFKSFQAIDCEIIYAPNTFGGDPVSLKHMREAKLMFDKLSFSKGVISFATDLLPEFEEVEFTADGNGMFGFTSFGSNFFGGASNSAPIPTYIPRNCQRCRYMVIKFNHRVAREIWSLNGISITGESDLSTRSYK